LALAIPYSKENEKGEEEKKQEEENEEKRGQ